VAAAQEVGAAAGGGRLQVCMPRSSLFCSAVMWHRRQDAVKAGNPDQGTDSKVCLCVMAARTVQQ
jgi:hypothetical protein